jgi:hypothetical protein
MKVKRGRNIPRQWEKRVLGKNSPYYAKYKSLYPGGGSREKLSKLKLERTIRNLSANAKISLLQPELAKAKKEVSERKELQSLLGPALGGDMDSLPDDPWFGKSPEEKHADVIQEEYGQLENIDSSILPGLNPKDDFTGQWETGFVGEREGEEEGALAFIGGDISEQKFLKPDDLGFADDALGFNKPTWGKDWEGEEESTLEGSGLAAKILRGRAGQGEKFDLDPQDKMDVESSFWERTKQGRVGDAFSGLFSSDDSGRDESLAKEKKDNEELSGKIGAAAKLYSLLQPETQQAAPTIPTARITRGSVAFPGMQLASQKPRRKYFTPKGLMA